MSGRNDHIRNIGLRAALLVLIVLADTSPDVHAEPVHWSAESYLETATNTVYFSDGYSSTTLHSVSFAAGLDVTSKRSPWAGGLFADYHVSANDEVDGMVNAGAYLKYRFGRWDTTSFVAHSIPPGTSGAWLYGTGLRYRLADGHKLGVHTASAAGAPESATLVLRYSGYLGRGVSLDLSYGAVLASPRHRIAVLQLAWEAF